MPGGGTLTIETADALDAPNARIRTVAPGDYVGWRSPIPDRHDQRVWRGLSSRSSRPSPGRGTGLGLRRSTASCASPAASSGWKARWGRAPRCVSICRAISLPRAPPPRCPSPHRPPNRRPPGAAGSGAATCWWWTRGTDVRAMIGKVLRELGCGAGSRGRPGRAAHRSQSRQPLDLLVTDVGCRG